MAITDFVPTGELMFIEYTVDVDQHHRSGYTRDGITFSDSEIDQHDRHLIAALDTGLGKPVEGAYSLWLGNGRPNQKGTYVSQIYFRNKDEAQKFLDDIKKLYTNKSLKINGVWYYEVATKINELKKPISEAQVDGLTYEEKMAKAIKQMLEQMPADNILKDAANYRYLKASQGAIIQNGDNAIVKTIGRAADQVNDAAVKAANNVGDALESTLSNLREEWKTANNALRAEIEDMANLLKSQASKVQTGATDLPNKIVEYTIKVRDSQINLNTLEDQVSTLTGEQAKLTKALAKAKKAKDTAEVTRISTRLTEIASELPELKKKVTNAKRSVTALQKTLDGLLDLVRASKGMKKAPL